jgi:predicted RND superfamily exporter protein
MRSLARVESVVSSLTFLPTTRIARSETEATQQLATAKTLGQEFKFHNIRRDGTGGWRTTAFVSALGEIDYVQMMRQLESAISEVAIVDSRGDASPQIQVSGLMPLVHEIQQQLLRDLFTSFLTAFALIAVVMTIVQAGVFSGLLSMIPNVFPALTLFGFLGWIERPLDIGSIMTASVAMGIAVDDTLHFLSFYQREIALGRTRMESLLSSYQQCGRALIQTTMICGSGIAIFGFSQFVPTSGFAWMTGLLLAAALVGDLILLPALLLSPFGKLSIHCLDSPATMSDSDVLGSGGFAPSDTEFPRTRAS